MKITYLTPVKPCRTAEADLVYHTKQNYFVSLQSNLAGLLKQTLSITLKKLFYITSAKPCRTAEADLGYHTKQNYFVSLQSNLAGLLKQTLSITLENYFISLQSNLAGPLKETRTCQSLGRQENSRPRQTSSAIIIIPEIGPAVSPYRPRATAPKQRGCFYFDSVKACCDILNQGRTLHFTQIIFIPATPSETAERQTEERVVGPLGTKQNKTKQKQKNKKKKPPNKQKIREIRVCENTAFYIFLNQHLLLSFMFKHDCFDTRCFGCLICTCFIFCTLTCSVQLSMFHMERRSEIQSLLLYLKLKEPTTEGSVCWMLNALATYLDNSMCFPH